MSSSSRHAGTVLRNMDQAWQRAEGSSESLSSHRHRLGQKHTKWEPRPYHARLNFHLLRTPSTLHPGTRSTFTHSTACTGQQLHLTVAATSVPRLLGNSFQKLVDLDAALCAIERIKTKFDRKEYLQGAETAIGILASDSASFSQLSHSTAPPSAPAAARTERIDTFPSPFDIWCFSTPDTSRNRLPFDLETTKRENEHASTFQAPVPHHPTRLC